MQCAGKREPISEQDCTPSLVILVLFWRGGATLIGHLGNLGHLDHGPLAPLVPLASLGVAGDLGHLGDYHSPPTRCKWCKMTKISKIDAKVDRLSSAGKKEQCYS